MNTLVAGEGATELGDWSRHPSYRVDPPRAGVLQRLIEACLPEARIVEGVVWKDIRKFRAGKHRAAEERNVMGLALHASERRLPFLVFSRDRDGETSRESDLFAGIEKARTEFPEVAIAGGVAVEAIESWVLSTLGHRDAERLGDPKCLLETKFERVTAESKSAAFDNGIPASLPPNASLQRFIEALRACAATTSSP